jgi:glycosyltransferase involved in cell wall biosynthesis
MVAEILPSMDANPSNKTPDSISIFFPAYNDWGTIASMVVLAHRVVSDLTDDFEIIVVNDASPDHLAEILEELQGRFPRLRVVTHEKNKGYGGALRSGFDSSTKSFIFYTDGDAQYDVRELRLLWEHRRDADLVNGYKLRRSDPWYRAVIGRMYHHFVAFWFRIPIRDVDCDFRLIRREPFRSIWLRESSGLICVEMLAKMSRAGLRIREVPVHHYHRMHGKSQFFNFARVARVFIGMTGLWWRIARRGELRVPPGASPEESGRA